MESIQRLLAGISMGSDKKVALVTGASGIQGVALIKKLVALDDWIQIYAIARRDLPIDSKKITRISLDLNNKQEIQEKLQGANAKSVTNVFHLAFGGDTSNLDRSTAIWMENVVDALEAAGASLKHVYFTQGTKYYGVHLGEPDIAVTPFKDEPLMVHRHIPPNFYFDQEEWAMKKVAKGAKWTWSALRPGAVIGWSLGYMNLLDFFAVYGTLCKETGAKFRYPGNPKTYRVLMDCTDVDLLTACQIWLSTHPNAQNTAYNINNGDVFRFEQIWPAMAEWFGVDVAPPLKVPLVTFMPQHKDTWSHIRQKYHLKDVPYDKLHQADFAESWLSFPTDAFSDVTKLRKAGFDKMNIWSEECFISWFKQLAHDKIIPDYPALRKGKAS